MSQHPRECRSHGSRRLRHSEAAGRGLTPAPEPGTPDHCGESTASALIRRRAVHPSGPCRAQHAPPCEATRSASAVCPSSTGRRRRGRATSAISRRRRWPPWRGRRRGSQPLRVGARDLGRHGRRRHGAAVWAPGVGGPRASAAPPDKLEPVRPAVRRTVCRPMRDAQPAQHVLPIGGPARGTGRARVGWGVLGLEVPTVQRVAARRREPRRRESHRCSTSRIVALRDEPGAVGNVTTDSPPRAAVAGRAASSSPISGRARRRHNHENATSIAVATAGAGPAPSRQPPGREPSRRRPRGQGSRAVRRSRAAVGELHGELVVKPGRGPCARTKTRGRRDDHHSERTAGTPAHGQPATTTHRARTEPDLPFTIASMRSPKGASHATSRLGVAVTARIQPPCRQTATNTTARAMVRNVGTRRSQSQQRNTAARIITGIGCVIAGGQRHCEQPTASVSRDTATPRRETRAARRADVRRGRRRTGPGGLVELARDQEREDARHPCGQPPRPSDRARNATAAGSAANASTPTTFSAPVFDSAPKVTARAAPIAQTTPGPLNRNSWYPR